MPSRQEKERRKALVQPIVARRQREAEAAMPISKPDLKALFDWLNETAPEECDGTLIRTRAFLHEHGLPEKAVTDWLIGYGGGCDCEVLANVEEVWGQQVGSLD